MPSAGRAAIVPKGEWTQGTAYERLDLVKYKDSIYFAKKDVPVGKLPTDTEYWMFGGKTDQSDATTEIDKIISGDTIVGKAWKDSDGNFINSTYLKSADLSEHTSSFINSQSGVHGLRYYQETLEYYDTSQRQWVEIETSGGGTTKTTLIVTTTTFQDQDITVSLEGKETLKDVFSPEGSVTFHLRYTGTYLLTCNGYTMQVTTSKIGETIEVEFNDETAKPKVYGFYIDGSLSNPDDMVSYNVQYDGEDVLNKDFTPVHMNFDELKFDYGSWKNVLDKWLCPKPCLLAQDGTVYCYLDENDYTLDTDGNDVTKYLTGQEGLYNAMCEWGKNGKKIWYKIVPDADDDTSATIYVADGQADKDFVAWSFYDCNDHLIDHFYTRIYEAFIDSKTNKYKTRSISGANTSGYTTEDNTEYINNMNTDPDNPIWEMQTFADRILISVLMILISKTLDSQTAFGNGICQYDNTGKNHLLTGTANNRGMFFGRNDIETEAVKIFGMENFYGNAGEEYQGCYVYNNEVKVKMTYGEADGTGIRGYNLTSEGYKVAYTIESEVPAGYVSKMKFNKYGFFPYETQGSESTHYCDYMRIKFPNDASKTIPVLYTVDGYATQGKQFGMFMGSWYSRPNSGNIAASLSCRPLAIPVSAETESEV